ncbi:hypothetical protein ACS0TY_020730 [Phlomoides rotata]
MHCGFALECWDILGFRSRLEELAYVADSLANLFLRMLADLDKETSCKFFMVGWWLWKERNGVCWEENITSPYRVVTDAIVYLQEWFSARRPSFNREACRGYTRCHRLQCGVVKINVDVVVFADSQEIGLGMVIYDDLGHFIASGTMWPRLRSWGFFKLSHGQWNWILVMLKWRWMQKMFKMLSRKMKSLIQFLEVMSSPMLSLVLSFIDVGLRDFNRVLILGLSLKILWMVCYRIFVSVVNN